MSIAEPRVEVIIPNWNGRVMLEHCLASLDDQSIQDFSVTVIDNGSEDGSISWLKESYPDVKCISLDHNTGFSFAVNCGIEKATAPWLLLLNNDMEVAPDCIEQLLLGVKKYPEYSFFALKMFNFYDRSVLDGAGDGVLRGGVGYRLGTLEEDREFYTVDRETFGACAGAALYSKTFFSKVGLFDPDFFAYLEDVDLNMRARRYGLRCLFLASARVYHIGSATSGSKINPLTVRLSTRNNIAVLLKNYPFVLLLRFLPSILVYQLLWLFFCLKKSMLRPYCSGMWEALRTLPTVYRKQVKGQSGAEMVSLQRFAHLITNSEKEVVQSIMARRSAAGKGNLLLQIYRKLFL